ncbi:MAG: hypothetical protein ACOC9Y_01605 [Chloroflexota bacterium]
MTPSATGRSVRAQVRSKIWFAGATAWLEARIIGQGMATSTGRL